MKMHLDHVMLAVRDLEEAMRNYRALGFDVQRGGRHPGRGTENALIRFSWEYLELIAIHDPAERAALGADGAGLTHLLEKRHGGPVDPVFGTDEIETLAKRFTGARVKLMGPRCLQRVRPDGVELNMLILQPDGPMSARQLYPGFIQWDAPEPERRAGKLAGAHGSGAVGIVGLSTVVADMDRAKKAYVEVLGLQAESEDVIPELGARRLCCRVNGCGIDLLAPTGPGRVQAELDEVGEGPFEVRLRVKDLAQARTRLADAGAALRPAPGTAAGWLLPEESTLGTRIVLVE